MMLKEYTMKEQHPYDLALQIGQLVFWGSATGVFLALLANSVPAGLGGAFLFALGFVLGRINR